MVDLIVRYLSFNKQISLKGIGTFCVEHLPARLDFPNRLLHAPQSVLHYSASGEQDTRFEDWVSKELGISLQEVYEREEILLSNFHRTLNSHQIIEWKELGNFSKDDHQLIHFVSTFSPGVGKPVKADKIIRKHQEHAVRVGEEEKTSTEMEALLFGRNQSKINTLWIFALALFLISMIAIWLFATGNPAIWKMQGNGIKIKAKEASPTYNSQ